MVSDLIPLASSSSVDPDDMVDNLVRGMKVTMEER